MTEVAEPAAGAAAAESVQAAAGEVAPVRVKVEEAPIATSSASVETAPPPSPGPAKLSASTPRHDGVAAFTAPVENAAAAAEEIAKSATTTARAPEHLAGVGSAAVEDVVGSAVGTAIVDPAVRMVGAQAPLDTARTALQDSGLRNTVDEAAAPLRATFGALPDSPPREDLASLTDLLFAPPIAASVFAPPVAVPAPRAGSSGSLSGPGQLPIRPRAAGHPPAEVATAPPVLPPVDPQTLGNLQPQLSPFQGPADGASSPSAPRFGLAAAAAIVRVDSVTGSPPAGPRSDPPASPSQAPGAAPGSGGAFFFVPLAALLALLALAAAASCRRLGEAPDFRPPAPFVCALERPG